jgi:hypothetical protein
MKKSRYGDTIEQLKAERAQMSRAAASERKIADLQRSEMEVALDQIEDDLILAGFKNPTAADMMTVYMRHHEDNSPGYPAVFGGNW